MGDHCTESTFWYDLSKESQDPWVTVGGQYRLVTDDPAGGCRKCAADINDKICEALCLQGCTSKSNSFWVQK